MEVEQFKVGSIFTIVGSRKLPFLKLIDGYVNLVTLERTMLEHGDTPVMADVLHKNEIMHKWRLSHVQYDGWVEYVEKHIKPKFIKEG